MPLIDSTDADIEAFDTVCRRLGGFGGRVTTEWADGYLTALTAGPRAVPIAEWLPRLAGDAFERAFADPEDEAEARAVLAARARVLANQLDPEELLDQPEQLRLQPLVSIWDEAGREELVRDHGVAADDAAQFITGALWAEGFLDAVEDFADDWELPADVPDEERELHDELLEEVSVLLLPEDSEDFKAHLEHRSSDRLLTREDLLDEACFAIQDLRVWWLDHAPRPATRRVEAVPGRNDPCPCGSGLKYKKCHGKAA